VSIEGFSVTTTGGLEDDTELMIHNASEASGGSVSLDLAKGQVNIFAVQRFLSSKILANENRSWI
jgi:hypothetical protein